MLKEKKPVVAKEEVAKDEQKEIVPVEDVTAEHKKAVVHENEVEAIKDSRKRDLPLFAVAKEYCSMWVVAVSEHQAKLALVDRVYPMEKCSKKDRDYRYLHLLESAAKTQEPAA